MPITVVIECILRVNPVEFTNDTDQCAVVCDSLASCLCHFVYSVHAAAGLVCQLLQDLSVKSHDRLTRDA